MKVNLQYIPSSMCHQTFDIKHVSSSMWHQACDIKPPQLEIQKLKKNIWENFSYIVYIYAHCGIYHSMLIYSRRYFKRQPEQFVSFLYHNEFLYKMKPTGSCCHTNGCKHGDNTRQKNGKESKL